MKYKNKSFTCGAPRGLAASRGRRLYTKSTNFKYQHAVVSFVLESVKSRVVSSVAIEPV